MKVVISKASQKGKKLQAQFFDNGKKVKTTPFGASGMSDFTKHKDEARRQRYLERHSKESWSDPKTPATLARYILWNKPTLRASIADYKKRFNLS